MKRALIIAAALIVGFSAPLAAWAQRPQPQPVAPRGEPADARGAVPLAKIYETLNRIAPGKPIEPPQQSQQDGVTVWMIHWNADGRRTDYVVNAQTGAIISHKP